jgi:formylglycine-generating enzyme required for sulfatase activity
MRTTSWVAFCPLLGAAFGLQAGEPARGSSGPIILGHRAGESFRDCADCPEMLRIPSGSFLMGSPAKERERDSWEDPRHTVQVSAFAIGKYAVTFEEWDACVAASGCSTRPSDEGWGRGRRPVINVSWEHAQEYASWLSKKAGKTYRLPSEAEWEYAARAGTTTAYYWGDHIGTGHANCYGCGSRWDYKQTAPVGSFDPNPWGLYDLLGNVYQWTQDCWHDSYRGAPTDGSAWTAGECLQRVVRGGSWNDEPSFSRSAFRIGITGPFITVGFRVVRTANRDESR